MQTITAPAVKPLLRGYFHQIAFFVALVSCAILLVMASNNRSLLAMAVYSLSLCGLFAVSALYHRVQWSEKRRVWMRRLDHSFIFILIWGTGVPICMFALSPEHRTKVFAAISIAAAVGVFQSLFWVRAPKWISSPLYVFVGWMVVPYISEIQQALGTERVALLLLGGIFYTVGAIVYGLKRPNPFPKTFGYHEIFHILVIVGAAFHFAVIAALV
jgi:hemolysin III